MTQLIIVFIVGLAACYIIRDWSDWSARSRRERERSLADARVVILPSLSPKGEGEETWLVSQEQILLSLSPSIRDELRGSSCNITIVEPPAGGSTVDGASRLRPSKDTLSKDELRGSST